MWAVGKSISLVDSELFDLDDSASGETTQMQTSRGGDKIYQHFRHKLLFGIQ